MILLETSDLDIYIYSSFLGLSKTNLMELFQEILSRNIDDLLLPDSDRNVDEPVTSQLLSSVFNIFQVFFHVNSLLYHHQV